MYTVSVNEKIYIYVFKGTYMRVRCSDMYHLLYTLGRDGHVQYLQRPISTNAHLCTTKGMSIYYTVRATRNVIGHCYHVL